MKKNTPVNQEVNPFINEIKRIERIAVNQKSLIDKILYNFLKIKDKKQKKHGN